MEVDERERGGWCPTDVVSNETDVEATLMSVTATACMYTLNELSNKIFLCTNQHFSTLTLPFI